MVYFWDVCGISHRPGFQYDRLLLSFYIAHTQTQSHPISAHEPPQNLSLPLSSNSSHARASVERVVLWRRTRRTRRRGRLASAQRGRVPRTLQELHEAKVEGWTRPGGLEQRTDSARHVPTTETEPETPGKFGGRPT